MTLRARLPLPWSVCFSAPVVIPLAVLPLLLSATTAQAQYGGGGPGMMPGGGGMQSPQPGMEDHTPEGPAEAAPDEEGEVDESEPLGLYRPGRTHTQVVELDGYFRLRTDWFHRLDLGQGWVEPGTLREGPPPFPQPIDCGKEIGKCGDGNLGAANTRLRLEPIINVTDQVRILSQIDILDNTIMGSTPDSMVAMNQLRLGNARSPHPILYNTQDPPELDRNSVRSSIRAKRVWGEVDSEFGRLAFGRMPWHWGRGMFFNQGDCLDCDGGSTVDRIQGITKVYGHQIALSWDFGPSGTTLDMTELGLVDREAFPLDLSQGDDVFQLTAQILRDEDPEAFRARAAGGELAVNYGFQMVYRSQDKALYPTGNAADDRPMTMKGDSTFRGENLVLTEGVDAMTLIPDLWFKLGWKALTIEFESAAVLGKISRAGPLTADPADKLTLAQMGWVLNSELALFKNTFFVGFETGGATGDQAENPREYLNYRWRQVQQPVGDNTSHAFFFSPQYHVDQILFRRILGTVHNAIYLKPALAYWLGLTETRQLGIQAAFIYSMAPVKVSTPGNSLNYGMELDLGVTYRNPADGFFAGFTWGVMWPFGALERPSDVDGLPWPAREGADASQVIRTFLGITF